ncbi:uncharacterized protein LOC122266686 [Penaeus japonicus]|uniref:uncharacterized protein LOC122266686 n=1 Tax=Penaeus japonicus TaxID=27405 RepID=UPI001C710CF3|nr:uncharacterized protein LOC122266686 [Penaeus japonicus]
MFRLYKKWFPCTRYTLAAATGRLTPIILTMPAGQRAEGLALNHTGRDGKEKQVCDLTVNTDRKALQFGVGVGKGIARSDDGRHSLGVGAYTEKSIGAGKSGLISDANVGVGVGYKFTGDNTSVGVGLHKQTFGQDVTERGGSLNVEHRLDNQHSVFGGLSHSKFDFPGNQSRADTSLNAGYRFDINDKSSVSATGHQTTFDFGSDRVTERGGSLGVGHRFDDQHSVFGGISQSKFDFPGHQSRTDTSSYMGYRFNINDTSALSATGHRTDFDFGSNMGRETSHGISFGFHKSF